MSLERFPLLFSQDGKPGGGQSSIGREQERFRAQVNLFSDIDHLSQLRQAHTLDELDLYALIWFQSGKMAQPVDAQKVMRSFNRNHPGKDLNRKNIQRASLEIAAIGAENRDCALTLHRKISPEQLELLILWKERAKHIDRQLTLPIYKQIADEFNREHPQVQIRGDDVMMYVSAFLGIMSDDTHVLRDYSERMKLFRIMHDDERRQEVAFALRSLLLDTMGKYHIQEVSLSTISQELGFTRESLSNIRIVIEQMMGYPPKKYTRIESIEKQFDRFWDPNLVDFPLQIKQALTRYAFYADPEKKNRYGTPRVISLREALDELHLGIKPRQAGDLVRYVIGDIPERITYNQFWALQRQYYWDRTREVSKEQGKTGDLSSVAAFLHLEAKDMEIFEKSIIPNNQSHFPSAGSLGREFHYSGSQITARLARVRVACERQFGPIPEEELEKMKEACAY